MNQIGLNSGRKLKILFKRTNEVIEFRSLGEASRKTKISKTTLEKMSRKIKSKFDSEIEIIAIEKPHTSLQETFAAIESINRRIMEERLSNPIAPITNQQPNQQTTQTS